MYIYICICNKEGIVFTILGKPKSLAVHAISPTYAITIPMLVLLFLL